MHSVNLILRKWKLQLRNVVDFRITQSKSGLALRSVYKACVCVRACVCLRERSLNLRCKAPLAKVIDLYMASGVNLLKLYEKWYVCMCTYFLKGSGTKIL